ncbi:MAG: chorismate mutase [Gaiellaceae bacterium]
MNARDDDPVLLALREEIAAADRDLLAAFIRRLGVAAKIRAHKAECGYDFVDLDRERRLLEEWRQANDGAVSEETLLELFHSVLSLSKREAQR